MSGDSQFKLFSQRRFMPFFMAQGLGAFNDNIFKNALAAMLVFEGANLLALNTNQLVNFSAMVFILPFFLFSALFGQFADKYEKSIQIRRVKLLEVVIMLLATLGFWLHNVPLLMFVLFLLGVQSTIFGPIKYGILPQILRKEELIGGNALIEMGTFVAILAGTIAGPQLAGIDVSWPYWTSAACLATAAAGYVYSRRIPEAAPSAPDLKISWNIFTETMRNMRFINQSRVVLNSVLGVSWFWFFGAIFLVQIPSYSQNVLGGDKNLMSALLAVFIIGISTGSLLCEKLSGRQIEIGLVPFGAIGLTLFGLDLFFASPEAPTIGITTFEFLSNPHNWRIMADLLLIGIFGGFYIVPLYALIQSRAEPEHRSRVIAGLNILNALFMVVAAIMAMLILGPVGLDIPHLFLISAILNALVSIYIFTLVPEFLMRFLVWILIHTIYRVRVTGMENIPEEGPVIVASNHVSFADPLIIGGMIRRPVNFVMYYKIYNIPVLNFIFRTGKAIPIAGRSEDPEILEKAYQRMHGVLESSDVLGIFPEGRITADGDIQEFKSGVDKVIAQTPVPVVPMALCHLWGSLFSRRDSLYKRRPYKLWSLIELRIGAPIPPQEMTAQRLQQEVESLRGDDR
jgi:1-acyl-sn-glycerol-3-phosphate acyltransferase